jgi:hypothetical protein
MATFTGARTIDGLEVLVDGAPLDTRTDLKQFTQRGFEWTYEGVEPAQLALAILARHLGDDRAALAQCDGFMREIVANLDNDWTLTGPEIDDALAKIGG